MLLAKKLLMSGDAGDPFFSDVIFLLNASGADGSTTITADISPAGLSLSGSPQVKTDLGFPAIKFDGSDDYVRALYGADFAFDANEFTFELFVRPLNLSGKMLTHGGSFGGYYAYALNYSGIVFFIPNAVSVALSFIVPLATGAMYHVAWQRKGTKLQLFKNGALQQEADVGSSAFFYDEAPITFGCYVSAEFSSYYMPAARITGGRARYSDGYNVPSFPFPKS